MSDSDLQLLERYTRQHAEDAFAEIVRRHLDLVFSAALRQVRSPQLAEEVAQSAFTDLARQAHRLAPDTVLTAWLYQVTRRTAIDVVRREARRQAREQVACELNAMNTPAADWSHIEPLLDEAMQTLDEPDRAAVLLRYFESKSLREVGQTFGTTEEAARKRVSRATERLREFFTKRGVTVGASGLVALLSANAVQAAPVGLAATISTAATLAGTAIVTTATATATKAIVMTTLQKTLITTALVAAVGTGVYEARQVSRLRDENQTLQQQQAPLADQIRQLQQERDAATRQAAALRDNNERLSRNTAELLRLRAELTLLRSQPKAVAAAPLAPADSSTQTSLRSSPDRVKLLKQRLEQMPELKIPELQFLTDKDWVSAADAGPMETEDDFRKAFKVLRASAKLNFGVMMRSAFLTYARANNGTLPLSLLDLQPHFKVKVEEALLQRYEVVQRGRFDLQSRITLARETAVPVDKQFDTRLEVCTHIVRPVEIPDPAATR